MHILICVSIILEFETDFKTFLFLFAMSCVNQEMNLTNPKVHLSHIPQCTIQNKNVPISVLNSALLDMGQVHCGICEFGLLWMIWCWLFDLLLTLGFHIMTGLVKLVRVSIIQVNPNCIQNLQAVPPSRKPTYVHGKCEPEILIFVRLLSPFWPIFM